MADTMRGDFPGVPCSDCGTTQEGEVFLKHWGYLVPSGEIGFFDEKCISARRNERDAGFHPRPLGTLPRAFDMKPGCFVKVLDLRHPHFSSISVFGRIGRIHVDDVDIILPSDLGHGLLITRKRDQVMLWSENTIPIGQLERLGMTGREISPEVFATA